MGTLEGDCRLSKRITGMEYMILKLDFYALFDSLSDKQQRLQRLGLSTPADITHFRRGEIVALRD